MSHSRIETSLGQALTVRGQRGHVHRTGRRKDLRTGKRATTSLGSSSFVPFRPKQDTGARQTTLLLAQHQQRHQERRFLLQSMSRTPPISTSGPSSTNNSLDADGSSRHRPVRSQRTTLAVDGGPFLWLHMGTPASKNNISGSHFTTAHVVSGIRIPHAYTQ